MADAQAQAERVQAMFVVRVGSKRGSRIALDADLITIGRHPDSDIFLDDITVSRRHAEVRRANGGFEVVDAGSLNGTYINKELIEQGPLSDGDELQVGKFKLVYLELGADD
ncbi:MAG: FHA domain-containing protein [Acidimicrobiales bacterium]